VTEKRKSFISLPRGRKFQLSFDEKKELFPVDQVQVKPKVFFPTKSPATKMFGGPTGGGWSHPGTHTSSSGTMNG
jgi:hypothetical protein